MVFAAVGTRARRALRCVFAVSLLTLSAAHAGQLQFGQRALYVPDPDGFLPLSQSVPRYIQLAQAYLPQTNRLVEAYAAPADAAAMEQGKAPNMQQFFQLQTLRKLDGVPVSSEDFASAESEIENGLRQAFGEASTMVKPLADKGNAEMKRATSVDPQVSMSDMGYLGVYRKEPWGQFFTARTKVSAAGMGKPQDLVIAGGVVMANYQIVFLYGYSHYTNEGDRQWAEKAVSDWGDQVHGANPDDPRVAAKIPKTHFDTKEMLRWGVIGGILGLIGALLAKVFRRPS